MSYIFKQLFEYAKKNPGVGMLLLLYTIGFFFLMGEIDTKADKDTVYVQISEVESKVDVVIGEISGMAKYFTGKKSFNGGDEHKYPPARYIIDNDSIIIPVNGYDSCICGVRRDTSMIRNPWFCYITDSTGITEIKEFR